MPEQTEPVVLRDVVARVGPIASWRWDPAEKTLSWSEGMFDVFGIDPATWEGHGHPVRELVHPEDRAMTEDALETIRTGERPFPLECRIVRKDGSTRWVRLEGDAMTTEAGKAYVVGIVRDITERRRAEEALRKSEEKFRTLVETMNDGLGVQDKHGRIKFVNESFCAMVGYSGQELIGRRLTSLIHESSLDDFGLAQAERRQGKSSSYELAFKAKNGRKVMTISSARPLPEGGSFAVITEITERKEAEDALRESEERYQTLIEKMADGVVLIVDGTIEYANSAESKIVGYSPEELRGVDPATLVARHDQDRVRQRMRALVGGDEEYSSEYSAIRKDGGLIPIEVKTSAITYKGRPALLSVVRVAGATVADGERKERLEETLRSARIALEEAIPFLPRDSAADHAAAKAIAMLYRDLPQ